MDVCLSVYSLPDRPLRGLIKRCPPLIEDDVFAGMNELNTFRLTRYFPIRTGKGENVRIQFACARMLNTTRILGK